MSEHIDDLRRRLFKAIDGLTAGTLSVEHAKQVASLSQVIVNSAKVEVDYLRATGGAESRFIDPGQERPALESPVNDVLRARLRREA